ncbi:MAG: YlbF family regulator [Clostridia bacterium]|nr:YlbF family regulator [Clostridia bacterium]
MTVIEAARKLGAAIQADEAYIKYNEAVKKNDENEELQVKISEFNIKRMNLDNELAKEDSEKNEEKIKAYNDELRALYDEIIKNPLMVEFNNAKAGMDKLLSDVNSIIMMCAQGKDPETCDVSSCTGNCSGCSGCH